MAFGLIAAAQPAWSAAITVTDDSGAVVTLNAPAHRVISLAPHTTELIYAAGGADAIVGAVNYSDYPPAARALPRVGDNQALDLEKIAALKPDLLVVWRHGNAQRQIGALRALGIPMFLSEPGHLPGIADDLRKLGTLLGTESVANRAADDFTSRIDGLRAQYAQRTTVSVFYQIWDNPLMTLGGTHMMTDVIRLCGGRNVFASLTPIAPTISTEAVIAANPDVIVTGRYGDAQRNSDTGDQASHSQDGVTHASSDADRAGNRHVPNPTNPPSNPTVPRSLERWNAWPELTAVARHNLFGVNADWMDRPAPRLADGAAELCTDLDIARAHLGR